MMKQSKLLPFVFLTGFVSVMSTSAVAGMREAESSLARADAKIEIVARNSSQPGMLDDQNFNKSQQRLEAAREAMKRRDYDRAEMLADQSSLLAELTAEKAKLAILMASRNDVLKASIPAQ
jgi:hypothetical protein